MKSVNMVFPNCTVLYGIGLYFACFFGWNLRDALESTHTFKWIVMVNLHIPLYYIHICIWQTTSLGLSHLVYDITAIIWLIHTCTLAHSCSLGRIECTNAVKMFLSIVVLSLVLTTVSADTDSDVGVINRKSCRDIITEMTRLLGDLETKFMNRIGELERKMEMQEGKIERIQEDLSDLGHSLNGSVTEQTSMKEQISDIAQVVGSLQQSMTTVQSDLATVKSVTVGK